MFQYFSFISVCIVIYILLNIKKKKKKKKSYKPKDDQIELNMSKYQNFNSRNFNAIAEINMSTYQIFTRRGLPTNDCAPFLENWIKFEKMAILAENKELNIKTNKAWKNAKNDLNKMWSMVDWCGKHEQTNDNKVDKEETAHYLSNIFMSEKTKDHPVMSAGCSLACICNPAKRRLNGRAVRVRIPSGERLLSRWSLNRPVIQYKKEPKLNRIVDWDYLSIEQSFINPGGCLLEREILVGTNGSTKCARASKRRSKLACYSSIATNNNRC